MKHEDLNTCVAEPGPAPAVNLAGWHMELAVSKLVSTARQVDFVPQTMILTADTLGLKGSKGEIDDVIPLDQIATCDVVADNCRQEGGWNMVHGVLVLGTCENGYNLSRKYCIAASFPLEVSGPESEGDGAAAPKHVPSTGSRFATALDLSGCLSTLVQEAKRRNQEQTLAAKFARSRLMVRGLFASLPFQVAVAGLLIANFVANAFEAQMTGRLELPDGSPTETALFLKQSDTFFTTVFAIELGLNLYAHWMHDFVSDGWSIFDLIVVTTSLVTPFLGDAPVPASPYR